jgi:hypothetical protein
LPTGQPICQVALNGEFGNIRDASVHADGTKSKLPKRVARALRRRNSLRAAIQLWGVVRSCYGFRDRTEHPTPKDETGGTAPLSSPSHISQVHRRHSAHTEQSAEITFLTSPSQFPPHFISWCDQMLAASQTFVFYRREKLAVPRATPTEAAQLPLERGVLLNKVKDVDVYVTT